MITKFQKFNLIKESPDKVNLTEYSYLKWTNTDAIPFSFIVNNSHTTVENIFVGRRGYNHGSIKEQNLSYAGRLWLSDKIISFWVYPNITLFNSIIENLENELNIKIFNNDWKIEVIFTNDGNIKKRDIKDNKFDFYFGTRDIKNIRNYKIIPIEDYIGSEDVSEEEKIQHLMSCNDKELAKKLGKLHFPDHFGSKLTAWDSTHNIKWRQAIYQENKKTI